MNVLVFRIFFRNSLKNIFRNPGRKILPEFSLPEFSLLSIFPIYKGKLYLIPTLQILNLPPPNINEF